ncbi:hypothetical protein CKO09_03710 [Chromatium weissei]|nr:hypothetical protein [Chromatium weissei]
MRQPLPAIIPALLSAGLLHVVVIGSVQFAPPAPAPTLPDTALDVLLLRDIVPTSAPPVANATPASQRQIGDSPRGNASVTTALVPSDMPEAPTSVAPSSKALKSPKPPKQVQKQAVIHESPPASPPVDVDALALPAMPTATAASIFASQGAEITQLNQTLNDREALEGGRLRRQAVSASTRELRYANYLAAWARKVERIGNLNYPQAARDQQLYGNLILHVAVRADGSVEHIRVVRSSGLNVLDQAAIDIVKLSAPYAPFPPEIAKDTDVLDIVRTWQFTRRGVLGWEGTR